MPNNKAARRSTSNRTCREVTTLIDDYLRGALPGPVRRDLERHLRLCPDCVSFLKTYRKTVRATQSLGDEDIPRPVRESVLTFLRKRTRQELVPRKSR